VLPSRREKNKRKDGPRAKEKEKGMTQKNQTLSDPNRQIKSDEEDTKKHQEASTGLHPPETNPADPPPKFIKRRPRGHKKVGQLSEKLPDKKKKICTQGGRSKRDQWKHTKKKNTRAHGQMAREVGKGYNKGVARMVQAVLLICLTGPLSGLPETVNRRWCAEEIPGARKSALCTDEDYFLGGCLNRKTEGNR